MNTGLVLILLVLVTLYCLLFVLNIYHENLGPQCGPFFSPLPLLLAPLHALLLALLLTLLSLLSLLPLLPSL